MRAERPLLGGRGGRAGKGAALRWRSKFLAAAGKAWVLLRHLHREQGAWRHQSPHGDSRGGLVALMEVVQQRLSL